MKTATKRADKGGVKKNLYSSFPWVEKLNKGNKEAGFNRKSPKIS